MPETADDHVRALLSERRRATEREAERLRREIGGLQAALEEQETYLAGLDAVEAHHGARDR